MGRSILILLLTCLPLILSAYSEDSAQLAKRYSFAVSYFGSTLYYRPNAGHTILAGTDGKLTPTTLPNTLSPRLLIGGFHFWRRADLYVSFPLAHIAFGENSQKIRFRNSIETGARIYPWQIKRNALRPFAGFSWSPLVYRQKAADGWGARQIIHRLLLEAGLGYTTRKARHWDLAIGWYPNAKFYYAISPGVRSQVAIPAWDIRLGYKMLVNFTGSYATPHSRASIRRREDILSTRSSRHWNVAAGIGSAIDLGPNAYNLAWRPAFQDGRPTAILPELGTGCNFTKLHLEARVAYRYIGGRVTAFGLEQRTRRHSLALELLRFFGDYHGFVPFLGAGISGERLGLTEKYKGNTLTDEHRYYGGLSLVAGWDIRPTASDPWLLRTNLRYVVGPSLLALNKNFRFDQLEINFIQLVIYPARIKAQRQVNRNI